MRGFTPCFLLLALLTPIAAAGDAPTTHEALGHVVGVACVALPGSGPRLPEDIGNSGLAEQLEDTFDDVESPRRYCESQSW